MFCAKYFILTFADKHVRFDYFTCLNELIYRLTSVDDIESRRTFAVPIPNERISAEYLLTDIKASISTILRTVDEQLKSNRNCTIKTILGLLKIGDLYTTNLARNENALRQISQHVNLDVNWALQLIHNPSCNPTIPIQRCGMGFFLCKQDSESFRAKHSLVYVKGDTSVNSTIAGNSVKSMSFKSMFEYKRFQDLFGRIGISALNVPYENPSGACKPTTKDNFYIEVSIYVSHAAEWKSNPKEFEITENAKDELLNLEELVSKASPEKASIATSDFFRKYGSHVYVGPCSLGGAFLIRTCGTDANDVCEEHKDFVKGLLSMQLSVGDKPEKSMRITNVWHECLRLPGFTGQTTLPFWDLVLKTQSKEWNVIQIGSQNLNHYIRIWDGDPCKFKNFKMSVELAQHLKTHWEKVSKMSNAQQKRTKDGVTNPPANVKENQKNIALLRSRLSKTFSYGQAIVKQNERNAMIDIRILSCWYQCSAELALKETLKNLRRERKFVQYTLLVESILEYGFELDRMAFSQDLPMEQLLKSIERLSEILDVRKNCPQETALKKIVQNATRNNSQENSKSLVKKHWPTYAMYLSV